MHLVGRHHRVRPLGPFGWGPAYVLSKTKAQQPTLLVPYVERGEWWRAPGGQWDWRTVRAEILGQRGAFGWRGTSQLFRPIIGILGTVALSQSTLALDSAYTYNTAGDGIAARFTLASAKTLSSAYVHITSFTGTAANVNDLNFELRNNSTNRPGTTLHDSAVHDPASTTGWRKMTGLTFAGSASTVYWAIVADADGNATDFATVLRNASQPQDVQATTLSAAFQSTGGFVGAPTAASTVGSVVLVFTDGSALGNPFTALVTSTSGTNQRGLRIDGLTETLLLYGVLSGTAMANAATAARVWAGTNGPSGTGYLAEGTNELISTAASFTTLGYAFSSTVTLAKSTAYRFVFTYGSVSTAPSRWQIGTGADANLRAAMLGGGNWYWTEDNAGAWADTTSEWPNTALLPEDQFEVATAGGGGGGARLITIPGVAA